MNPITPSRLDVVIDQAARALRIKPTDRRSLTILRTLVQETLLGRSLDAVDAAAVALGITDGPDRAVLRTLVKETLRIWALDEHEPAPAAPSRPRGPVKTPPPFPPPMRGDWDEDAKTPVDWNRRKKR